MSSGLAAGAPTTPAELNGGRRGRRSTAATALASVELTAQRDAPVGGQAVLEGVMMRGVANWAVAVRKPTAEQLSEDEPRARGGGGGRDRGERRFR